MGIVIEGVAKNFVCISLVYVYRFMVACWHSSCKVSGC